MWYYILGGIILILLFFCINLFINADKLEEITLLKDDYISKIQDAISFSEKKLKEIDEKGAFESDDEIGWFFENIKYIQSKLNEYKNI